jgi:hypothetical protein
MLGKNEKVTEFLTAVGGDVAALPPESSVRESYRLAQSFAKASAADVAIHVRRLYESGNLNRDFVDALQTLDPRKFETCQLIAVLLGRISQSSTEQGVNAWLQELVPLIDFIRRPTKPKPAIVDHRGLNLSLQSFKRAVYEESDHVGLGPYIDPVLDAALTAGRLDVMQMLVPFSIGLCPKRSSLAYSLVAYNDNVTCIRMLATAVDERLYGLATQNARNLLETRFGECKLPTANQVFGAPQHREPAGPVADSRRLVSDINFPIKISGMYFCVYWGLAINKTAGNVVGHAWVADAAWQVSATRRSLINRHNM